MTDKGPQDETKPKGGSKSAIQSSPSSNRSSPTLQNPPNNSSQKYSHTNGKHSNPSSNSIAAELNAKLTAKHNTRLKQHGNAHLGKPSLPAPSDLSSLNNLNHLSDDKAKKFLSSDSQPDLKHLFHQQQRADTPSKYLHQDHDVESRLSASKIAISAFKSTKVLNFKRT